MNFKKESINPAPKFNSTNLYVTITQIILKSDPKNPNSWNDLYRLLPYLRNSLCCVICLNLLVDPLTPTITQCQHHLCRFCKERCKEIKRACKRCKDCDDYMENKSLRILLQCYKKMCISLINSPLFQSITMQASQPGTEFERSANYVILLIKEGALTEDNYKTKEFFFHHYFKRQEFYNFHLNRHRLWAKDLTYIFKDLDYAVNNRPSS